MKLSLLASLFASTLTVSAASADVTVMDNDVTQSIDCARDGVVNLLGNHITVTLTGACQTVSVAGNHNSVRGSTAALNVAGNHNMVLLDAVDDVAVLGNENTVRFKRALTAKQPHVSNVGRKNQVSQP